MKLRTGRSCTTSSASGSKIWSVCRRLLLLRRQLEPESPEHGSCAVGFFSPCKAGCVLDCTGGCPRNGCTASRMLHDGSCARRQLCSRLRRGGCAVSQRSAGKIGDKPLEYPQAFRSSQGRSKARGISYVSAVELLMNTNFSSSPGAELAVELISIVAFRVFLE